MAGSKISTPDIRRRAVEWGMISVDEGVFNVNVSQDRLIFSTPTSHWCVEFDDLDGAWLRAIERGNYAAAEAWLLNLEAAPADFPIPAPAAEPVVSKQAVIVHSCFSMAECAEAERILVGQGHRVEVVYSHEDLNALVSAGQDWPVEHIVCCLSEWIAADVARSYSRPDRRISTLSFWSLPKQVA